jgi:hypothetical protein
MDARTDDLDYDTTLGARGSGDLPAELEGTYPATDATITDSQTYGSAVSSGDVGTTSGQSYGARAATGGSDTSDDTGDDTHEIRQNIEQTRAQMSSTIDAIQERLSPQNLVQQAKDSVREATIGRAQDVMSDMGDTAKNAGYSILDTIRENPLPAALAGIGLGWLIMKARGHQDHQDHGYSAYRADRSYGPDYGYRGTYTRSNYPAYQAGYNQYGQYGAGAYRADYPRDYRTDQQSQGMVSQATDKVQNMASQATDKVQDAASNVADTAQNVASNVSDTAQQWAGQAQDQAQQLGYEAQWQAQRARGWLEQTWESNPLAMGAVALAAGALIGGLIPETQKENQWMGEARENLVQKAQDVAQDTMNKVQNVAQEVASQATETAKQAAQQQGLTGSSASGTSTGNASGKSASSSNTGATGNWSGSTSNQSSTSTSSQSSSSKQPSKR